MHFVLTRALILILILLVATVNSFLGTFGCGFGRNIRLKKASSRQGVQSMVASYTGSSEPLVRVGHGYDIHRLKEGTPLVISGVKIPSELGAHAHSDGDAVYHSIVDAILGALSTGKDIGVLFPDNDPQWKGADSSVFMKEAVRVMKERGYSIGNVDVTLILEKPKVKDLKSAMVKNIVELLETSDDRVNVKARTHEKVDSVGECRAYECHVVVILERTSLID